ncbi:hypothetical protein SprV_0200589300 [Sparganum proliferum]
MLQTWQLKDVRYSFHVISDYKKKTAWMNSWHYATATSALRLYIPEILNDTQKVLSLDTDVILLDDISELWDFIHEADERQMGGGNVGVLLLHLDRLRQRGWPDLWRHALDDMLKAQKFINMAEQDIFNVAVWMHKDLFYPLPCEWNLQLAFGVYVSACPHSRSLKGHWSVERPNAKLLHMNRRYKYEYTDDEWLTSADVPATETSQINFLSSHSPGSGRLTESGRVEAGKDAVTDHLTQPVDACHTRPISRKMDENRQGDGLVARWVEAWTSKPTGREFEARVFHTSGLGMAG